MFRIAYIEYETVYHAEGDRERLELRAIPVSPYIICKEQFKKEAAELYCEAKNNKQRNIREEGSCYQIFVCIDEKNISEKEFNQGYLEY